MNTEYRTNLAAFVNIGLPNFDFTPYYVPTGITLASGPAAVSTTNRNMALSTGLIGTGLVFAAIYANLFKAGRHGRHIQNVYTATTTFNTTVHWLEYPAEYTPPVMDLFSEDPVPFGFSSSLSCPKDLQHLELAFDVLRHKHLSEKLGVPSVVGQGTLIELLQILGNTSSGSSLSAAVKLLSRPQTNNIGVYRDSNTTALASIRLSLPSDDRSDWMAPILVGISLLGFLAQRGLCHRSLSEPTSPETAGDILDDDDDDDRGCDITPTTYVVRPPGSRRTKTELHSYWDGISPSSLTVAIDVYCLLAKRGRRHQITPTTRIDISELLDYSSYTGSINEKCAPLRSSKQVLGILINPSTSIQELFEDDFLVWSYTPYTMLEFPDDDSDSALIEKISALVDFAARFDALWDARRSLLKLRTPTARDLVDVARFAMFGVALVLCVGLRLVGLLCTGRFVRRGIQRLAQEVRNANPFGTLAVEVGRYLLSGGEFPLTEEGGSEHTNPDDDTGSDMATVDDAYVAALITPLLTCSFVIDDVGAPTVDEPSCPISATPTLVDHAVETFMAPADDSVTAEAEGDGGHWTVVDRRKYARKGQDKATDDAPEVESVEQFSKKGGSRGHGRGRTGRRAAEV